MERLVRLARLWSWLPAFRAVAERLDPAGKFRNAFVRELIP
jgi:hypothetical protein